MRRITVFLLIIFVISLSLGCTSNPEEQQRVIPIEEKPEIQTTIYPVYYFASRIVGEKMEVKNFIPVGVEPHSWEPKPSDLVKLEHTQYLIYNGADFENWMVNLKDTVNNKELIVVNATEGIELLENADHDHSHSHSHSHSHQDDHDYDPHVWLNPIKAQEMAINIKVALAVNDPENREYYQENLEQLLNELDELDRAYQEGLSNTSKKEIIVTHAAFGYLAERYSLKQIPLMGVNLHAEPTPGRLAEVVKLTAKHGIEYVFAETLVSPKVAEALAEEAGIKVATLNPIENLTNEDINLGSDYFSIMYENLEVLVKALK